MISTQSDTSGSEHRLSLARIELAARTIDPVFLNTPQFVCEPLGRELGVRLALKIETLNPVRSFKGRGCDFLASQIEGGRHLICASAGNFGQALAYACRARGLQLTVYAANTANPLKIERMRAFGAEVVLHGADFDEAKLGAKRASVGLEGRFVEDSLDIETLEGAGTIGLELAAFSEPLDALLVALGNGAMFNGIARAMKALRPQTRIIAVQAAGAPAMVESWRAGKVVEHRRADTIADGIAVRIPIPQALADMQGLADDAILVNEESIVRGMRLLHRHAGVVSEPSGAVGIAAILENRDAFRHQTVGVIVCGGNPTRDQMRQWLLETDE